MITMRNEGSFRLLFSLGGRERAHGEARFAQRLRNVRGDLWGAGGVAVDAQGVGPLRRTAPKWHLQLTI